MNTIQSSNLFNLSQQRLDAIYSTDIAEYQYDFEYIISYWCLPMIDSIVLTSEINEDKVIIHPEKIGLYYSVEHCRDNKYRVFHYPDKYSLGRYSNFHFKWELVRYFDADYDLFEHSNEIPFYPEYERFIKKGFEVDETKFKIRETTSMRLEYMREVLNYFDTPIGRYMIERNDNCWKQFEYRLSEFVEYDEGTKIILNEMKERIKRITDTRLRNFGVSYTIEYIFKNHTSLNYFYKDKNSESFREDVREYGDLIKEITDICNKNRDVVDPIDLYYYIVSPLGMYWAELYSKDYVAICEQLLSLMEFRGYNLEEYRKQLCLLLYKNKQYEKPIAVLQKFCRKNRSYFRFMMWIRSREFNEWFYHPDGIGGRMHLKRMRSTYR